MKRKKRKQVAAPPVPVEAEVAPVVIPVEAEVAPVVVPVGAEVAPVVVPVGAEVAPVAPPSVEAEVAPPVEDLTIYLPASVRGESLTEGLV
jgi:hypothetical protein